MLIDQFKALVFPHLTRSSKLLFLCALSVSFVFRIIYPNIYHHFDVSTFISWGPYLNPIQNVYMTECYCNYPIFGMLLSTGILKFFDFKIFSFLIFLCFIDAINVVLIWFLMRLLNIRYALMWSALIGLSFSSWIGGAQWGQIDNIGQLFLLLVLILCFFFLKAEEHQESTGFNLNILVIGFLMSIAFLTKQLLLFPLIPIAIFLFFHILVRSHPRVRLTYLFSLAFSFLFPIFLIDLWLSVPDQYIFSHLERIFDNGSEHINTIAGNGFNIWLTFFSDQNSSSAEALVFGLSPKILGLIFFVLGNIYLLWCVYKLFRCKTAYYKFIFVNLIGYFAFYNLLFNVVLTGTHERYLYHFYPYLIIFLLFLYFNKKDSFKFLRFDLISAFFGASLYGFFVFSILLKFLDTLLFHRILIVFHLIIFLRLLQIITKINSQLA